MTATLFIDGHVHYHACFGVGPFLEAALSNFRKAGAQPDGDQPSGCLMFSESSSDHYFREFADGLIEKATEGWKVEATSDSCSFFASNEDDARILMIAGRQIVTSDRLEVLALATAEEYPDGLPFRDAVEMAVTSRAVTVLPWGFGKWTGGRGRLVEGTLRGPLGDSVYLGDNGGRPELAPEPSLFRLARDRGVPILPGSDPLPIGPEVTKPGRFGFVLSGRVDPQRPAATIRELLRTRAQPRRYGRLEGLGTFLHRQTTLRLQKRAPKRAMHTSHGSGRP